MKIRLIAFGKAHESHVKEGVEDFTRRLNHYFPTEWMLIPSPRNAGALSPAAYKQKEAESLLPRLNREDHLVCLDEKGKQYSSIELANFLNHGMNAGTRQLVFLIGGAYGIDDSILKKARETWSLSRLTFPHQLVRLILAEQLYRAATITRNENYHHK